MQMNKTNSNNLDYLRPFVVVIYGFLAAISLYALRHLIFAEKGLPLLPIATFNVGAGIIYLWGWYHCLAWCVKSFRLSQTFPCKSQYVLVNLLGIIPFKWETDLFVRWQVKPFELEGLQILMWFVMGYFTNLVTLGVICLFMVNCHVPAKMTLKPSKITFWSVISYGGMWLFCGLLLLSAAQDIFCGCYYHTSVYLMLLFTILSVFSGRQNKPPVQLESARIS